LLEALEKIRIRANVLGVAGWSEREVPGLQNLAPVSAFRAVTHCSEIINSRRGHASTGQQEPSEALSGTPLD
jgi:hypothetical protein